MSARGRRGFGFFRLDRRNVRLPRVARAEARPVADRMFDERQHRRSPSGYRLSPSLQSLPAYEADHPCEDQTGAGDRATRHKCRCCDRQKRSPRGREDAGAMTQDLRALLGRPVIVGAGVAGLLTALRLAPEPVVLLSKAALGVESSSAWAQGGLAASLGEDDDPALHLEDTLAAG